VLHVAIELGGGDDAVLVAAALERSYAAVCLEAYKNGSAPPQTALPSVVASAVRFWTARRAIQGNFTPLTDGLVPVYHVPARGWALFANGVSFVVGRGEGRVLGVFSKELPAGCVKENGQLVISRQAKGWLASFEERKESADG